MHTTFISAGPCSVALRTRCIRAAGTSMPWDRGRVSSATSIVSSCLRLIVRMIAVSDVTFTPSMAAETSRDAITCASDHSRPVPASQSLAAST